MTDNVTKDVLGVLFDETVNALREKIREGTATASDLAVARGLLKDNDITVQAATEENGLGALADSLPDPEDLDNVVQLKQP